MFCRTALAGKCYGDNKTSFIHSMLPDNFFPSAFDDSDEEKNYEPVRNFIVMDMGVDGQMIFKI